MAKKLLILFLVCLGQLAYAQNESNIWYFGSYAGLDFNSGSPVVLSNSQMETFEATATISDSFGQLLFYSDGVRIWNRIHQVMPNGTDLLGSSSSSQGCVILPKPGSSTIYYVFTSDDFGNSRGFRYSEVDITLENGLGNVNSNKNILLATPVCEKITAIKKSDGQGYWVITHDYGSNKFMSFSVSPSGVNPVPVISNIGSVISVSAGTVGYLKASPDGTKIVSCNYQKNLEIFDFNSHTGELSNAKVINNKKANYGAEFSPSGKLLYVSTGDDEYIQQIVQYNLANNDMDSPTILSTTNSQYGGLQLARDGKIYVSLANSKYLSVIHQPENIGSTCSFEKNGTFIGPGMCIFGLPQSIPTLFNIFIASQNVCLGNTAQFSMTGTQNITSVTWDFGDGTTSDELSPSHLYSAAGNYNVTVTAHSASGFATQSMRTIVSSVPLANPISNKIVCERNTIYNLIENDGEVLGTQTNPIFEVAYFTSEAEAHAHINILQSPYVLSVGTTTFIAKVYNSENLDCYDLTSFTVTLMGQIVAGQPGNYNICESMYDGFAQFDLAMKNNEILNGLDAGQFVITYHKSHQEAENRMAALPLLYTNVNPQEIVFARLESIADEGCYAIVSFEIAVWQEPRIGLLANQVECGASRHLGVFDLTEKNPEVLGNLSPAYFSVQYYLTQQDALNDENAIVMPYIATSNNQTLYVVVEAIGNPGCRDISSFDLMVLPSFPLAFPKALNICDDSSNDGVAVFDFDEQTTFLLEGYPAGAFQVTYHLSNEEAVSGNNGINQYSNISNPQTIYARITSELDDSCFQVKPFSISVHSQPIMVIPDDLYFCSEEGETFAVVDLSSLREDILSRQVVSTGFTVTFHLLATEAQQDFNPLSEAYKVAVGNQTLYIRIENSQNPSCFVVADFQIEVYPRPVLEMRTHYILCGNESIEITAPENFDSYNWSTGENTSSIMVATEGTLTLTVTRNNGMVSCSDTEVIRVEKSSEAIIKEIVVNDWTNDSNSIRIIVQGSGDYEYSIDGTTYQSSPEFQGLKAGDYTIYVRDINGCGIVNEQAYFLVYPKFFTPNGDGHNEKWHIKSSGLEPEMKIHIFDRTGKLLISLNGQSDGWDGTHNNYKLPSADYWFVVERKSGKSFRGHFSLIR